MKSSIFSLLKEKREEPELSVAALAGVMDTNTNK